MPKRSFTVTMETDLQAEIDRVAAREDRSRNYVINTLCRIFLAQGAIHLVEGSTKDNASDPLDNKHPHHAADEKHPNHASDKNDRNGPPLIAPPLPPPAPPPAGVPKSAKNTAPPPPKDPRKKR